MVKQIGSHYRTTIIIMKLLHAWEYLLFNSIKNTKEYKYLAVLLSFELKIYIYSINLFYICAREIVKNKAFFT